MLASWLALGTVVTGAIILWGMSLRREVKRKTQELLIAKNEAVDAAQQATKANNAKSQFLANMSHELRTPLTAILGHAESLDTNRLGPISPKQKRSIGFISESAWHLLSLINEVLALAKIEAGQLTMNPIDIEVKPIVDSALKLVQSQACHKDLQIEVDQPCRPVFIKADPLRTKQIITNLLSNAIKYTEVGGNIGIIVSTDDSGSDVSIVVWDTGVGISKEDQAMLFQPFVQLTTETAKTQEGTGLGLVLVKHMVELQNGKVELDSQPNKGTRVTITLPCGTPTEQKPAMRCTEPTVPKQTAANSTAPWF